MARNHLPKMGQLFHLARTCLNNMLYNKHIELETRGRTVYLSADRPHCKKVGERIHGACKRCSHAHLVPAWTVRHRRLWLERLRLCRFPRLVQTTLLADSAPYDDELWRLALSVVLGRAATLTSLTLPNLSRQAIWSSTISTACTWLRPQQRRLRCHLCWPPPNPRPCRRTLRRG